MLQTTDSRLEYGISRITILTEFTYKTFRLLMQRSVPSRPTLHPAHVELLANIYFLTTKSIDCHGTLVISNDTVYAH